MKRFLIDIEGEIEITDLTRLLKNFNNIKIVEAKVETLYPERPIGWDR